MILLFAIVKAWPIKQKRACNLDILLPKTSLAAKLMSSKTRPYTFALKKTCTLVFVTWKGKITSSLIFIVQTSMAL